MTGARMAIHEALSGGNRRSIGRADEVVRAVLAHPVLFGAVLDGLPDGDSFVRMRCCAVAS